MPADASRCAALLAVADLSDSALDRAARSAAQLPPSAAAIIEITAAAQPSSEEWRTRLTYAVKKLTSAIRGAAAQIPVGYDLTAAIPPGTDLSLPDLGLGPYIDALIRRPDRGRVHSGEVASEWVLVSRGPAASSAASDVIEGIRSVSDAAPAVTLAGLVAGPSRPLAPEDWRSLERLQAYLTADVSHDPTATRGRRADGSAFDVLRFFDAKTFTPILLLPEDRSGSASIDLSGGPFAKASVENLVSGVRRDFDLRKTKSLSLDLSKGPMAVVLHPAERPGGETKATVDVGAVRGLTAEEIVARERAWDAGQRERVAAFVADMKTSLRFRIAEVNETFDLTIRGPFFFRRGESADWEWDEFYLNGVRWKDKTLPKLPILQPEKVTTLPLDIRLTEDYAYALHGEATIAGRRAYHITYVPRSESGDKPVYRGSVWIDKETFALLRRDSVQLNLKGETLSNVQSEFYRPVPEHPEVVLPLEIKGQQVFSTAGRTTAIERDVTMTSVEVNPSDFAERRAAAHASPAQMIRDTENGMRYLIPDPARQGSRIVEEHTSKRSLFGLLGGFYDDSLSYPIPLLGLQYFDFDLWNKGKQLSVFFGGALLTANYTDPSLLGSRFDLGVDLFAVAVPFGDVSYHQGQEVSSEKVKHLPAVLQANFGHPLGPYLKGTVSLFSKWDDYQRDKETGPTFRVPVDTFTNGVELRLVANVSGFTGTFTGDYLSRERWEPWGEADNPDYSPRNKNYWTWGATVAKDQYFPGFRKLHVGVSYLSGARLDRFSKYEFGTFSGHPLRGYKSGSLRTETAFVANVSYGLNIEDIIRFEGFYDQAVLRDSMSGFHNTYFSGAGLLASLNGPWKNSLLRAEIGTPVVSHGVHGVVVNVLLLKLF